MRLTIPPLNIAEDEGFSKKDIFNRKSFGEALFQLITKIEDEIVLCLDAKWGEGKTTFVKMWRGYLAEKGVKSIYFDAFKNDFIEEPFTALSAEIYSWAKGVDAPIAGQFKDKAIQVGKALLKSGVKIGIKTLTLGALDGTELDNLGITQDLADEASRTTEQYLTAMLDSYKKDQTSLDECRKTLSDLANRTSQDNKPLVFIIDELDRCRPIFALEMLERIKHIFSIPKIVFILVMNREQMEEAIKFQYGAGIDANQYLQKFINVWCSLPKNNTEYSSDAESYMMYLLKQHQFPPSDTYSDQWVFEYMGDYVRFFNLTLRETEQAVINLVMTRAIIGFEQGMNVLAPFLAILKVKNIQSCYNLKEGKYSFAELVKELGLDNLTSSSRLDGVEEKHVLTWALRQCLITDEELATLPQGYFKGTDIRMPRRKKLIPDICHTMLTFYHSTS